jgi:hypothetical protein
MPGLRVFSTTLGAALVTPIGVHVCSGQTFLSQRERTRVRAKSQIQTKLELQ